MRGRPTKNAFQFKRERGDPSDDRHVIGRFCVGLSFLMLSMIAGCGTGWGPVVDSTADIDRLSTTTTWIRARGIHDEDVGSLVRLRNLQYLDLAAGWKAEHLRLTDAGLGHVLSLELQIDQFSMGYSETVTDNTLEIIGHMKTLKVVIIRASDKIGMRGLRALSALPHLEWLDLSGCTELTGSDIWELRNLHNTKIDAANPGRIILDGDTHISASGIDALRRALPGWRITRDDYAWQLENH